MLNNDKILTKTEAAQFFRMNYAKFVNLYLLTGKLPLYRLADERTVILYSDCIELVKNTNPVIKKLNKNIYNPMSACPDAYPAKSGGEISATSPLALARRGARAVPDGRRGEV